MQAPGLSKGELSKGPMNRNLFLLFLAGAAISIGFMYFREDLKNATEHTVALRHTKYVCEALSSGQVTKEEFCNTSVPEIESLRWHFAKVKAEDGVWYQERGWDYFPQVQCREDQVVLLFMGRRFICDHGKSVMQGRYSLVVDSPLISLGLLSVGYAAPTDTKSTKAKCYDVLAEEPRVRTVREVRDDGSLVFDENERGVLLGIDLPAVENEKCGAQARNYVKAKLLEKPIQVYQEKSFQRDNQHRLRLYAVTQQGEFFNLELIRYGLAKLTPPAPGEPRIHCFDEFMALERLARAKELGLWGNSCAQ